MLGILRVVQGWIKVKDSSLSRFLNLIADGSSRNAVAVKQSWTSNNNAFKLDLVLKNGGTATHSEVVAADSYLTQISCSSSGEFIRYEIVVNGVTRYVFFTGIATYNEVIALASPIKVLNTQTVTVEKTNLSNKDVDVYSTIVLEAIDG